MMINNKLIEADQEVKVGKEMLKNKIRIICMEVNIKQVIHGQQFLFE